MPDTPSTSSTAAPTSTREALRLAKQRLETSRDTLAQVPFGTTQRYFKGQLVTGTSGLPVGFDLRNEDDLRAYREMRGMHSFGVPSNNQGSGNWRDAVEDYTQARSAYKEAKSAWQSDLSKALEPQQQARTTAKEHLRTAVEALRGGTGTEEAVQTARGELRTAKKELRGKEREYRRSGIPSANTTSPTVSG